MQLVSFTKFVGQASLSKVTQYALTQGCMKVTVPGNRARENHVTMITLYIKLPRKCIILIFSWYENMSYSSVPIPFTFVHGAAFIILFAGLQSVVWYVPQSQDSQAKFRVCIYAWGLGTFRAFHSFSWVNWQSHYDKQWRRLCCWKWMMTIKAKKNR